MNILNIFSLVGSLFAMFLAVFTIWLSFQQRKESQKYFENTKDIMNKLEKVMATTETLVSENFQNLLKSITNQQEKMIDALKPKDPDYMMTELLANLAKDNPEQFNNTLAALSKIPSFANAGKGHRKT